MLLYTTPIAPNPRRVRIFLAEKGVSLPTREVNLLALEQKADSYKRINPLMAVPALVLDDGETLTETIAICRYLESLYPEPPLFGVGARAQAFVEMWQRRVEFGLFAPVGLAFRHSHPRMAALEQPQLPELAETQRRRAAAFMRFLDETLATRRFIAGDAFTIADITALVAMDLTKLGRVAVPEGLTHLTRWWTETSARPSAVP